MITLTLQQVLDLVGPLDDAPGDNTARERFRRYLTESVRSVNTVREYVQTCLQTSGTQYCRALQDIINHTARLMGFTVEFGRYQGVQGQIGHDGIWQSGGLSIVIEVKTSDVYSINTSTLVGYVDQLISSKQVSDWDHALGLYIVGRPDTGLTQLQNAITGERRSHQLRVATVNSILAIAELVQGGHISTEEALALLRPTEVLVDNIVGLLSRVASKSSIKAEVCQEPAASPVYKPSAEQPLPSARMYLLTPIKSDKTGSAQETIQTLLGSGWYVFGEKTPLRTRLKPGDKICFYESKVGIVAEAEVTSTPEKRSIPGVRYPDKYPWAFQVTNVRFFFDQPISLDQTLRSKLNAFAGRDPNAGWAWFVQATHTVSEHDYGLLTGQPT